MKSNEYLQPWSWRWECSDTRPHKWKKCRGVDIYINALWINICLSIYTQYKPVSQHKKFGRRETFQHGNDPKKKKKITRAFLNNKTVKTTNMSPDLHDYES